MVTNRLSEAIKLFWSCQTRLKLELKHEFHIVIKFEECLKACHRVIIQGEEEHIEEHCARIPFRILNRTSCCQKMFVIIRPSIVAKCQQEFNANTKPQAMMVSLVSE